MVRYFIGEKCLAVGIILLFIGTFTIPSSGQQAEKSSLPGLNLKNLDEYWNEIQKLLASDGTSNGQFGVSVSLSKDTALIGAWSSQTITGSAYIFTQSGTNWTQQAKLVSYQSGDYFGHAVSLDGDTALIGAYGDNILNGAAYVFTHTGATWTLQAKLLASDGAMYDSFGCSVDLDGDTAIIGAEGDSDNGVYSGSAYVFTRSGTTWTEQQKLLASDGAEKDNFGCSVSVSGETVLIGANGDYESDIMGSAYVFTRSGTIWTQQAKLLASDGAVGDGFGHSVSLSGDTVLIGAHGDDFSKNWTGSAYVYTRMDNNWTQQQKLLASDGSRQELFGCSVSLEGDTALIGAQGDYGYQGSAYVFTRTGANWTQYQKVFASDGNTEDDFGHSVSLDNNTTLFGAFGDDDYGSYSGSAYVFTKSENQPPAPPTINGPEYGTINTSYTFSIGAIIDPDGDQLYCQWDWGDGKTNIWLGPYNSGEPVSASHVWREPWNYSIRVRLKDSYGAGSIWSEPFKITIRRGLGITVPPISIIRIQIKITNHEHINATYVNWKLNISWGPSQKREKNIAKGTIEEIKNGDSMIVQNDHYFFGFGLISVTISVQPENILGKIQQFHGFKIGPFIFLS